MEGSPRQPIYDILEHISDGLVALDKTWHYIYVNRRAAEMLGRRPEDLTGKHIWTEFPERVDKPFYKACYRALEEQVFIQTEEYYHPWNRWVENRIYPYPEGLTIFYQDITEKKKIEEALLETETRLRVLTSTIPNFILEIDKDEIIRFLNRTYKGITMEDALGTRASDWLPETQRTYLSNVIQQAFASGQSQHAEYSAQDPEGKIHFYVANITPLSVNGRAETAVLVATDITPIKNAEKALQEMSQYNQQIIKCAQEGIIVLDHDLRYTVWNPFMESMTGIKESEILGKRPWEVFPFLRDTGIDTVIKRALEGETLCAPDTPVIVPRTGERGWVSGIHSPLRNTGGEIIGVIIILNDITERKKAEEEKNISEEELRTINKVFTLCANTLNLDELLQKVLDETLMITGLERGMICLLQTDSTLRLTAHRGVAEATVRDFTINKIKVGEYLCGTCARDKRPLILRNQKEVLEFASRESFKKEGIHFHAAFPLTRGETCLGVLSVSTRTDNVPEEHNLRLIETITAQISIAIENALLYKKTLDHAVHLEKTVDERTEALQKANLKLQELDRLKSLFIASMSHELRTPLNSIIGFTGIILQGMSGELSEEQSKQLSIVQKSARHLLELISDIIDVSRIEAERVELFLKEFDLSSLLRDVVESFTHASAEKGLILSLGTPEKLLVKSDERRIKQVLNNLLSNAIKFTVQGGIEVTVLEAEGRISIRVRDTGIGIKSEDQENLFKAFSKFSHEGIPAQEGTGLGLYLSRKIAVLLGGELRAESEFGKGSTFTFVFPKIP